MKRAMVVFAVLVLVVVSGYFGYRKYEEHKIINSIYPFVKDTTLIVKSDWAYVVVEGGKSLITRENLVEKLEADIWEINKRIFDTEAVATPSTKEKINTILSYLKSCKELLLAQLNVEQKEHDVFTTSRFATALMTIDEYDKYVGSPDFETKDLSTISEEGERVRQSFLRLKQARKELLIASQKLVELLPKIATVVPQKYLLDKFTLEGGAKK